jgi:gas vesicle protein
MKKALSFFIGAVMGGLVGATMAILLTPASGKELRVQLRARADAIRAEVQQAAADRRAELERQLTELRAPKKTEQG